MFAGILGVSLNHLHSQRGHEVRIALARRIQLDSLEIALRIVTTTEVLHLRRCLNHGCEAHDSDMFGVILGVSRSEAWLVS